MANGNIIIPDYLPKDYSRIRVVDSFAAVCGDFQEGENALLLPRRLTGNFNLLARALPRADWKDREAAIRSYAQSRFHWRLRPAAQQVLQDMEMLRDHGRHPEIRVVRPRYYDAKVLGDHVDGGNRIICCYNKQVTEFLRNEDAVPDGIRANGFRPMEGASHYAFHEGDIWQHKGVFSYDSRDRDRLMAEAFIHRAPRMERFAAPRLMLLG